MEDPKNSSALWENNEEDTIDLIEMVFNFFRIAKRFWWLFIGLVATGIIAMVAVSYVSYSPMYRCEVTFTVSTGDDESFYYSVSTANQMSLTFPYILDSSYFRSVLLDALGLDSLNGTITAETIENSNLVTMRVESPSAEDARSILDAALAVYPEVSWFVLGDIEFHLIDDIETPTAPYNEPSLWRILGYGGLGGLAAAVLIVGLMALFNHTIKTTEDMERMFSLVCLGALPQVRQKARKNSAARRCLSVLDPRTPHAYRESMHALVARVRDIMRKQQDAKILLVTSSVAGEGKTTVAINLAEQLARGGDSVLLVDLDLRRQQHAVLLDCDGGVSIADVLRGQRSEFIKRLKQRGLYLLGGRRPVDNPEKVLGDPNLGKILGALRGQMDYIILDTPPCGLFQDAAILADYADATLLVVGYDTVVKGDISEVLSMLESRRAKVLGYLFNSYPQTGSHYGYGYGSYGYRKYGYSNRGSGYGGQAEEKAEEDTAFSAV